MGIYKFHQLDDTDWRVLAYTVGAPLLSLPELIDERQAAAQSDMSREMKRRVLAKYDALIAAARQRAKKKADE